MRKILIALLVLGLYIVVVDSGPSELRFSASASAEELAEFPPVPGDSTAEEDGHGAGHQSPVLPILLALMIILLGAHTFGGLFEKIRQPAVLGELGFGIVLGYISLQVPALSFLRDSQVLPALAELGLIILLFDVGLESNVGEMRAVGLSSFLVAILGIIAPFLLGYGVSIVMLPDSPGLVHVFIGATLCATSVGITARVLADLGKIQNRESKIILGAAVIDDILGLVILAVVVGSISAANTGQQVALGSILKIVAQAVLFLAGAIALGPWFARISFRFFNWLKSHGMLLPVALAFCFGLSWLANKLELATIVGAFAAGLILDDSHYQSLTGQDHHLETELRPIHQLLVPIFFVFTGFSVDITNFAKVEILGLASALTVVAILGKLACAAGVWEKGLDRLSVAIGMVPRGEVGLIFAGIGSAQLLKGEPVISSGIYSAVVIMVILTTLLTPPALKWSLARGERIAAKNHAQQALLDADL